MYSYCCNYTNKHMVENVKVGCILERVKGQLVRIWITRDDVEQRKEDVHVDVQRWLRALANYKNDITLSYRVAHTYYSDDKAKEYPWQVEMIVHMFGDTFAIAKEYGKTPEEALHNVNILIDNYIDNYFEPIPDPEPETNNKFNVAEFIQEVDSMKIDDETEESVDTDDTKNV